MVEWALILAMAIKGDRNAQWPFLNMWLTNGLWFKITHYSEGKGPR